LLPLKCFTDVNTLSGEKEIIKKCFINKENYFNIKADHTREMKIWNIDYFCMKKNIRKQVSV